jgi:hypothetical protein
VTTTPSADVFVVATPIGLVLEQIAQAGLPSTSESDATLAGGRNAEKESNAFGLEEAIQGRRVGELAVGNSQRTLKVQMDQWSSQFRLNALESRLSSEEFVLHGSVAGESDRKAEDEAASNSMTFTVGTAVSTAIGTGAILWMVQATQLAATLVSAAAPTWMQMDIASALSNLAKEKSVSDEASAKIFE